MAPLREVLRDALDLGNLWLSLLVIAIFALAMAALSVFIGSLCAKEDIIIEVVPPAVRQAGMVSPAYWAMDALHKLRFFQGDFAAILPHLGVLLGLSAALSLLAARYFEIRD